MKAQDEPAGRRTKMSTSTGSSRRAPRGPNCPEQLHLGPPPTHHPPIGPKRHLSSGLLPFLFLSCGAGMLVPSSVSFLARPWTHHVPLSPVLLLAGPGPSPHCAWGSQWTCLSVPSLDAAHPVSESPASAEVGLPSAPSSSAPRHRSSPAYAQRVFYRR